MTVFDLDSTVIALAGEVSELSDPAKAALFGACGSALRPLLDHVEHATAGRWEFSAARSAFVPIAAFVTSAAGPGDHRDLRRRILESGPGGHDLDSPWSTYVQDALICIDAALVAASIDERSGFKPVWIFSALEPVLASLNHRGYDADFDPVEIGSTALQREMDGAVEFLSSAIDLLSGRAELAALVYETLVNDAKAIVPPLDSNPPLRF